MRVLLVNDEDDTLNEWQTTLENIRVETLAVRTYQSVAELVGDIEFGCVDLAIVDIVLGCHASGFEVAKLIRRSCPATKLVLVSQHLSAAVGWLAARRGVLALPKPLDPATMCSIVQTFGSSTHSAEWVLDACPSLSGRQAEVVRCAVAGLEDDAIASVLGIKLTTLQEHWRRVFDKTGKRSQRDLAFYLLQWVTKSLGLE